MLTLMEGRMGAPLRLPKIILREILPELPAPPGTGEVAIYLLDAMLQMTPSGLLALTCNLPTPILWPCLRAIHQQEGHRLEGAFYLADHHRYESKQISIAAGIFAQANVFEGFGDKHLLPRNAHATQLTIGLLPCEDAAVTNYSRMGVTTSHYTGG